MKIKYKIFLPIIYLLVGAYFLLFVNMGFLLTIAMGLPWSFFMSFITGPVYIFFPNFPSSIGFLAMLISSLTINTFILYKLGGKIDTHYEIKKING